MSNFRNLYKFFDLDNNKKVVAFITAPKLQEAIDKYKVNGGKCLTMLAEEVSKGYPEEICTIYE